MTFAYWSIFIIFFIPYLAVLFSKTAGGYSNAAPPEYFNKLGACRQQRAKWAFNNGNEMFPIYAAAIIIGHIQEVDPFRLDVIAGTYIALRIAYIFSYIFDFSTLRSVLWSASLGCVFGIFLLAGI